MSVPGLPELERRMDKTSSCSKCKSKFSRLSGNVYSATCGHSVCYSCYVYLPKTDPDRNYPHRFCWKCAGNRGPQEWFPDFKLMNTVENFDNFKIGWETKYAANEKKLEESEKLVQALQEEKLEAEFDSMKCSNCDLFEKRDRMHICMQCAMLNGVKDNAGEEEMKPFFICSYCVLYVHKGHTDIVRYVPWEIRRLISAAVEENDKFVDSLDPYFVKLMEKRNGAFAEWVKNTRLEKKVNFETIAYKEGLEICENMAKERDIVKRAVQTSMDEFDKCFASIEKPDSNLEDANSEQEKTDTLVDGNSA